MTDDLAQAVRRMVRRYLEGLPPDRKVGVVTAVTPDLEVIFPAEAAATVVAQKAASYTPALDDDVVVERIGSTWVAVYAIEEAP